MKNQTATIAVMALAMITASVDSSFAMIGETPQQFEPRKPDRVTQLGGAYQDGVYMEWFGKRYRHAGWFYHGHAMSDSFQRSDGGPLTEDDFNRFLKAYSSWTFGPYQRTTGAADYALAYQNGRLVGAMFLHKSTSNLEFVNAFALSRMEQPNQQPTARSVAPQPQPAPQTEPADPTRTPSDCTIIAGQAHDRIKKFASWSQIVGINWILPDGKTSAHAAVFYKYQADGNVFYYDESGALELDTTSQELDDIKTAFQAKIGKLRTVTALKFLTH
jgi:hypothetical protein